MSLDLNDLIRIIGAGGGFTIDARAYLADDLVKIAGAAAKGNRIHILNARKIPIDDLVRISGAGTGTITFDLA